MTTGNWPDVTVSPELGRIGARIAALGGRPVLVGGWVRDALRAHLLGEGGGQGASPDVEVFGLSLEELRGVLKTCGHLVEVGRHFGVLKLRGREAAYDFSLPRQETKTAQGHRGFAVSTAPHLSYHAAAARRDFTMNSIGYAFLEGLWLDPFRGVADIKARCLRHVGAAFSEDPLRVLRALQFAARFRFQIDPGTLALCRRQDLSELPRERIWEELKKCFLQARAPSLGWRYAGALGLWTCFPELARVAYPHGRGRHWRLTLAALDIAARRYPAADPASDADDQLVLLLAILTHALHPPAGRYPEVDLPALHDFLARLTNRRGLAQAVSALVTHWPAVFAQHPLSDGALRRLALRVPLQQLTQLALVLRLADWQLSPTAPAVCASHHAAAAAFLRRASCLGVAEHPPQPLLKGRHLKALGLRAGPQFSVILGEAFELQLDGVLTSLDALQTYARSKISEEPTPTTAEAPARHAQTSRSHSPQRRDPPK